MSAPSLLVAGDFAWPFYEPDFCLGLAANGATVSRFRVGDWLGPLKRLADLQLRAARGPGIALANAALRAQLARVPPQVLVAWRTPWLAAATVAAAQRQGTRVVLTNNDDPFGPDRELPIWRAFRALIPRADACFVYRSVNVPEYFAAGAQHVALLRSWYNPSVHRPIPFTPAELTRWQAEAVFVGHFEPDGRLEALEQLARRVRLRVRGPGWAGLHKRLNQPEPIVPAHGQDYVRAIAAARVALVFLSTRNRDQYTRRCFEIPAIGTLMLAPRTAELATLFTEGRDAAFFGSPAELVAQVQRYLGDDVGRRQVALSGQARVRQDGHDLRARAGQFLGDLAAQFPQLGWSDRRRSAG